MIEVFVGDDYWLVCLVRDADWLDSLVCDDIWFEGSV